ncbi:MAG TPA: threonine synthase [Ignavibacteria bacterium]|nr:threonine synthase [Ignavibacteria bacterium]
MKYYSTNNQNLNYSFREAIMRGLASDGGLIMPQYIPALKKSFINNLNNLTFQEIAFEISKLFITDKIPSNSLQTIIEKAINFKAPLYKLNSNTGILELFYGPTLAFKDFGARFMAQFMNYYVDKMNNKIDILVATSGDTGSAVASAFYGIDGINVYILYPSGMVSQVQEKQLTTFGNNITALEIKGSFDDCQNLVKKAFVDKEINEKYNLTSANSINIARLIPQSFYYFEAYKQITDKYDNVIFSVPSGNLGNLTAGLFAKKMGLPITKFIAANNFNNVFSNYIKTKIFKSKPTIKTISNAMDVGNPSNFIRIFKLYNEKHYSIVKDINSSYHSDEDTLKEIKYLYKKYNYLIDPHGAVASLALKKYIKEENPENYYGVILETAHPFKFNDILKNILNINVEIPDSIKHSLEQKKVSIELSNTYSLFREFLLSRG